MNAEWEPPKCEHGKIILGCPLDDCAVQNDYLAGQNQAIDDWYARQQAEARRIVRSALGLETT